MLIIQFIIAINQLGLFFQFGLNAVLVLFAGVLCSELSSITEISLNILFLPVDSSWETCSAHLSQKKKKPFPSKP